MPAAPVVTPTELTPTAAAGPASRFDAFKGRDELIDRVEEKQRLEAIAKAQERRKAESMVRAAPESHAGAPHTN